MLLEKLLRKHYRASGQFASNLGVRSSADESQSLIEGIGSNVAESAIAGAGMGAVGSAISETPRAIQKEFNKVLQHLMQDRLVELKAEHKNLEILYLLPMNQLNKLPHKLC